MISFNLSIIYFVVVFLTAVCTQEAGVILSDDHEAEKHASKGAVRTKGVGSDAALQSDTELYQRDVEKVNRRNRQLNQTDEEEDRLLTEFKRGSKKQTQQNM